MAETSTLYVRIPIELRQRLDARRRPTQTLSAQIAELLETALGDPLLTDLLLTVAATVAVVTDAGLLADLRRVSEQWGAFVRVVAGDRPALGAG